MSLTMLSLDEADLLEDGAHVLFGLLSIGAKLTELQHLEMLCTAGPQNTHINMWGFMNMTHLQHLAMSAVCH